MLLKFLKRLLGCNKMPVQRVYVDRQDSNIKFFYYTGESGRGNRMAAKQFIAEFAPNKADEFVVGYRNGVLGLIDTTIQKVTPTGVYIVINNGNINYYPKQCLELFYGANIKI